MSTESKTEKSTGLPIDRGGPEKDTPAKKEFSLKQLILGLLFGIAFGFLLQKGGVAKYHILLGVLFLEDFTVVKVMLTAIVVGGIGIFSLYGAGLGKAARQTHPIRSEHYRRIGLRNWICDDRVLSRDGGSGTWPRKLGRNFGYSRSHDWLVLVCRSVRIARKDFDESR